MNFRSFFPVVLMFCFAVPVHGATRYVDNSQGGNCSNSTTGGSETAPWCTISYALGRISGGDTLYVKSGTYNETFTIGSTLSGTAGQPTLIAVYPGHAVTIQGTGVNGGRVRIQNAAHLVFDGFVVTAMNHGIFIETSSHVTVRNCRVHYIGQEAIHVFKNSAHVTIENCEVSNTGNYNNLNGEGIYIGSGSSAALDNTNHVVVRNTIIFDTTDEGIELKPGTHDCLLEGNTLYNIDTGSSGIGSIEINQHSAGNQTWGSDPQHIARNNVIHNSHTAIRVGTGAVVYNNLIYGIASGHRGILVNNLSGDNYVRRIYHNTIDMPGSSAVVVSSGSVDVRNNIGPSQAGNMIADAGFFRDPSTGNYRLVAGSAPIDVGVHLAGVVTTDADGNPRSIGAAPDLGAYEFGTGVPSAPTNLRIIRQ